MFSHSDHCAIKIWKKIKKKKKKKILKKKNSKWQFFQIAIFPNRQFSKFSNSLLCVILRYTVYSKMVLGEVGLSLPCSHTFSGTFPYFIVSFRIRETITMAKYLFLPYLEIGIFCRST